jgi:pyridoxal phosphate enzyme (YggS family)
MEHLSVNNLKQIENEVQLKGSSAKIVVVSKSFEINDILPVINYGHKDFGENRIQEAIDKWSNLKKEKKDIKLHFIGKLQTNKVKFLLPLFDYIHSLDSLKLAKKISEEQKKKNFKPKIFIQINIGNEKQKTGILENDLQEFLKTCKEAYDLDIIGLMCLPPNDSETEKYFSRMKVLKNENNLKNLSMGMSNDYLKALNFDSSFLRIGSKIFGQRN